MPGTGEVPGILVGRGPMIGGERPFFNYLINCLVLLRVLRFQTVETIEIPLGKR